MLDVQRIGLHCVPALSQLAETIRHPSSWCVCSQVLCLETSHAQQFSHSTVFTLLGPHYRKVS